MLWPKKNSYKEFDNEKIFLRLENSPLPLPPVAPGLLSLKEGGVSGKQGLKLDTS